MSPHTPGRLLACLVATHSAVKDPIETNQTQSDSRESASPEEANLPQTHRESPLPGQRFPPAVDDLPVLILLSDVQGNLKWVNRTWETWTGRTLLVELTGDWTQHIHPDDRDALRESFATHQRNREPFALEYRLANAQGNYGWVFHQCKPLLTGDDLIEGFLATCTDISWQKQRSEEQRQIEKKLVASAKLDSLGLMAGGIAHDFNNLLTGILGNIELAQWETSAAQGMLKTVLADARTATLRAADLCRQMLAYSGKGQFTSDNCDLNAIITETLRFFSASMKPAVNVQLALAEKLPEISADAIQVRQIIMNLTINASESIAESGNVLIRTGITRMELEGQHSLINADLPLNGPAVFFEIHDTGTGMTPDVLSRAFEPFFTTKFIGRGLGLAAVHGIVKGHQGRLSVTTGQGAGTTVRVILPVFQEGRNETIEAVPKRDLTWNSKILIVDDEEIVARTLHRYLDHMRIPAEYVLSGRECLARISANPQEYGLVLLDLTMAPMDGYETFNQLRKITSRLQVVLISGFTEKEATRNFHASDLAGFLPKPISEKSLMDLMRRLRS